MPIIVEANLRIPSLSVANENGTKVINNQAVRFHKMIEVSSIPKPDDQLDVTTGDGTVLPCRVTRSDWEEDRQLFIVFCKYAPARITHQTFTALQNDPDWRQTELPG